MKKILTAAIAATLAMGSMGVASAARRSRVSYVQARPSVPTLVVSMGLSGL